VKAPSSASAPARGRSGPGFGVSLSSVTRWLLVVVGCVVLETAQPMIAAEATSPEATSPAAPGVLDADRILYPSDTRPGSSAPGERPSSGGSSVLVFVALVGLAAGGLWLWRRRHPATLARRGAGIVIEDTRALGNRQFLVVAGVDGRRFLLGVAPGSIRLLSPLDSASGEPADADDEDL
jgi:flagellar protein FliO/FliZ